MTEPTGPVELPDSAEPAADTARARRRLSRILHRLVRSPRGLLVLFLLVGGFGSLVTFGAVAAVHYTETASFCSRCHTMQPELTAYQMSAHREVACAECHVEPGRSGWVKAKVKGTKQLFEVLTDRFPRPIPPPDHADLPAVKDTCLRCHSLNGLTKNGGPVRLVMRVRYNPDQKNTREQVAVVLRPAGLGPDVENPEAGPVRGVHWHIAQRVTYTSSDVRAQTVDLVEVSLPDGTTKQYIGKSQVRTPARVDTDVARLAKAQRSRVMDCIDCHNRVGHQVVSPDRAVDESISAGKISAKLPFVKRDAVALLNGDYPSRDAARTAIDGLRDSYRARYPLVLRDNDAEISSAIEELKTTYDLVATPEMKVQARTYPDNLGHQTSPGCFRCHDGAHFRVVKGKLTGEKIPSTCATCHSFPQLGGLVSGYLGDGRPTSHGVALWAFTHKKLALSPNPTGTSCGGCHARAYCENCHSTGAIKVGYAPMIKNHPALVRASGVRSCVACHQTSYCVRCHTRSGVPRTSPP